MVLTKNQAMNFLQNQKNKSAQGSVKYLSMGFMHIMLNKDALSVEEIMAEIYPEDVQVYVMAEFPEYA